MIRLALIVGGAIYLWRNWELRKAPGPARDIVAYPPSAGEETEPLEAMLESDPTVGGYL